MLLGVGSWVMAEVVLPRRKRDLSASRARAVSPHSNAAESAALASRDPESFFITTDRAVMSSRLITRLIASLRWPPEIKE
jgi:hypothetical protein